MKKVLFIALAACALFFTSCKKEHTCTCTTEIASGEILTSTSEFEGSKSDAEAFCSDKSAAIGTTCTLD